jgi:hypothetical protein
VRRCEVIQACKQRAKLTRLVATREQVGHIADTEPRLALRRRVLSDVIFGAGPLGGNDAPAFRVGGLVSRAYRRKDPEPEHGDDEHHHADALPRWKPHDYSPLPLRLKPRRTERVPQSSALVRGKFPTAREKLSTAPDVRRSCCPASGGRVAVSAEIKRAIELYLSRAEAEEMIARDLQDEPDWRDDLRVERLELTASRLTSSPAYRRCERLRGHPGLH